MTRLVLITITAIMLSTSLWAATHASRAEVLALLRREGILAAKTQLARIDWDSKAKSWFVSLRHPDGGVSNWTVDAEARDYHFVCKN